MAKGNEKIGELGEFEGEKETRIVSRASFGEFQPLSTSSSSFARLEPELTGRPLFVAEVKSERAE
jgi:hypothetical protein